VEHLLAVGPPRIVERRRGRAAGGELLEVEGEELALPCAAIPLSKFGDARGPIPRGNLAVGIPDVGLPGVARRPAAKNCAGGKTIGGRAARKADEG
jgi:hypothetical protein